MPDTQEQDVIIGLMAQMTTEEQLQLIAGMLVQSMKMLAEVAGTVEAHTRLLAEIRAQVKR